MKIESDSLAVASKVVKTFAMNALRIRGDMIASNNRFLQLHDAKALPANTAIPLRTYPVYATAPFDFNSEQVPINFLQGMVVALSTTEQTLTASADTMNLFVTGESAYDDTGFQFAGDYTTGAASFEIWSVAAGATDSNKLKRLEFTALSDAGAVLYAKLFAEVPSAGVWPIAQIKLARNTSKDCRFDTWPLQSALGVSYQGLGVIIDNVAGAYDGQYAGTDFALKGSYV